MKLIGKGAEADIYLRSGRVVKERISKAYRVRELDEVLRKTRTKREARLISLAHFFSSFSMISFNSFFNVGMSFLTVSHTASKSTPK